MDDVELRSKITMLREQKRGVDEEYDAKEPPPKKEEGIMGTITLQCIIILLFCIAYLLCSTFAGPNVKKLTSEIKTIITNDVSFKETLFQTVGNFIAYLNEVTPVTQTPEDESAAADLNGVGGPFLKSDGETVPVNATLAEVIYTGDIRYPVDNSRKTSEFGFRESPFNANKVEFHNALDIASPSGENIYAAASGTVITATFDVSLGNYVVLEHTNGFKTTYGHCSEILVSEGMVVRAGEVVARVGSTGDSTGPHVHFAASKYGIYFNPQHLYSYIDM